MTAVSKSAQLYLLVRTALQEVKGLLHSDPAFSHLRASCQTVAVCLPVRAASFVCHADSVMCTAQTYTFCSALEPQTPKKIRET